MADKRRMTVLEAAEALGMSDDTIRRGLEGKGPLADVLRDAAGCWARLASSAKSRCATG